MLSVGHKCRAITIARKVIIMRFSNIACCFINNGLDSTYACMLYYFYLKVIIIMREILWRTQSFLYIAKFLTSELCRGNLDTRYTVSACYVPHVIEREIDNSISLYFHFLRSFHWEASDARYFWVFGNMTHRSANEAVIYILT